MSCINLNATKFCHCGQPLHYSSLEILGKVSEIVDKLGEFVTVVSSTGKQYLVQRHYIALHGIKEQELDKLGFKEID